LSAGIEGASTHLAVIYKHVLKQILRPKYAWKQCVIFGKKLQKNRAPVRTGIRSALTHIAVI